MGTFPPASRTERFMLQSAEALLSSVLCGGLVVFHVGLFNPQGIERSQCVEHNFLHRLVVYTLVTGMNHHLQQVHDSQQSIDEQIKSKEIIIYEEKVIRSCVRLL
ncbi:hypothetical protein GQX74_001100 [Glossina fuscipes]|nr:hypothetical protein GQX74_001100 [Glossina fuscipes]